MNKYNLRVGDRYTSPHNGSVFTITHILFNEHISVDVLHKNGNTGEGETTINQLTRWLDSGDRVLIKDNQMKFKIGDKVTIKPNQLGQFSSKLTSSSIGEIVKIPLVSGGNYNIKFDELKGATQIGDDDDLLLVTNNMTIQVGDIVTILEANNAPLTVGNDYEVRSLPQASDNYTVWNDDKSDYWYYKPHMMKLVDKGEIVGYELLKDLPGISAGTKSAGILDGKVYFHFPVVGEGSIAIELDKVKTDTTWFKPIYKPTEVIVEISDSRKVLIEKDKATIKGVDSMSMLEVEYLYKLVNPVNKLGKHTCGFNSAELQVGCQKFTKQDIDTVYYALTKAK